MEHASFNRRLFAGLIDGVVFFFLFFFLAFALKMLPVSEVVLLAGVFVVCLLYIPLMCFSPLKGTVGMLVCRTKLLNDDKSECSFMTLLIHSLLSIIIHVPLVSFGVIPFFIYNYIVENKFSDGKMVPDYIAKTQCFRR